MCNGISLLTETGLELSKRLYVLCNGFGNRFGSEFRLKPFRTSTISSKNRICRCTVKSKLNEWQEECDALGNQRHQILRNIWTPRLIESARCVIWIGIIANAFAMERSHQRITYENMNPDELKNTEKKLTIILENFFIWFWKMSSKSTFDLAFSCSQSHTYLLLV